MPQTPLRAVLGAVLLLVSGLVAAAPGAVRAAESAVVVMYHRFGEDSLPSTNIRVDQFETHLKILTEGDFTVLPLPEIVAALKSGRQLPPRTVGITIDDAYLSVFDEAWPRLREAGFPFTVFVATDPVDRGLAGYMSWEQLRTLKDAGVTIGSQTASHPHMPLAEPARNAAEIADSNARFRAELGVAPDLFAYPYGEASATVMRLAAEHFDAAFGQHSGALHRTSDRFYLPRYAMNESYGDEERFRLAVNSLPVPVSDVTPADPLLTRNPPLFGFTVAEEVGRLRPLSCFSSSEGRLPMQILGRRVEVRFNAPLPEGRNRINCTMPAREGRWRWFGMQYLVAPTATEADTE